MSVDRIHRLLRLITLLQSGRAGHVRDLVSELGVSRRTLFRDLRMLGEAGLPYHFEPGAGYRISAGFLLPPVSLNVSETLGLLMLAKYAAAERGRPLIAPALSAINKLASTVPEPVRAACVQMMANVSIDVGGRVVHDGEEKHYLTLQQAADECLSCELEYRGPLDDQPIRCRLDPYVLHFAARAWYVIGRTDLDPPVRVFKLARILAVRATDRRFQRPRRFTAASKLGKAWLLKPEGKIHLVELEFAPLVAVNVSEVRWHATQKQRMLPDGRCRMRFEVDGLDEIAWWLCGYAGQVKVLAPEALRQRVLQMHRKAIEALSA